ncbi:MAG: ribonucleotide-diphosphate reductase subunit beta [Candidatus Pacebacteria bacterium]|nr:ribonucleotide-diphosphate reductase subunit beta [Candidatus Paceibacterota bacterium]
MSKTQSPGLTEIIKRDGSRVPFDKKKIVIAVEKAMRAAGEYAEHAPDIVADAVVKTLAEKKKADDSFIPSVEGVQDEVERVLMLEEFPTTAKSYILYRQEHALLRKRDIFKKRINLKPYEYPELLEYVDAIRHSYWIHTEFNFTSDIQDFKVHVTPAERTAIKNAMLAIAQIEVSVKTFWGNIYHKLPKPEIGNVGYTFAESEVRHQDAYAHLLEILGLNHEFEKIKEMPAILKRVNYLEKSIQHAKSDDNRDYAQSILLFSLFVEHVSLFSQFLIIMAFNKHKNIFKGISNVIEATSKEEQIHGLFGIDIINIIKQEHPEWFDDAYNEAIIESCREAYEAESAIVDWIFEDGELEHIPSAVVKEFIKNRFNNSLSSIGLPRIFPTDAKLLDKTEWFDDEVIATKHGDFFVKRSINYNKRSKSITEDDLF